MALNVMQGDPGSGKSYVAVCRFMVEFLETSDRPIYTNLPLELDSFLVFVTRNQARRESYRSRIHLLEDKVSPIPDEVWQEWQKLAAAGDEAAVELVEGGRERHQFREFWWFVAANAVVFLDESADIWNALDRSVRPKTLQSYVNHHRHWKHDLYLFCQAREDLDNQVRRKFQYVWDITNSTKTNMFDWWALKGLRWPWQFFKVRCYLGRQVYGRSGSLESFETQRSFNVWPTARGFRCYRSFSHATTLPGMRAASEQQRSSDLETPWQRMRGWLGQATQPLAVLASIVAAVIFGIRGLYWMAGGMDSATVARAVGSNHGRTASAPSVAVVGAERVPERKTNAVVPVVVAAVSNAVTRGERVLLVSPSLVVTDRRRLGPGDDLGGGRRIGRILRDGIETDAGQFVGFGALGSAAHK